MIERQTKDEFCRYLEWTEGGPSALYLRWFDRTGMAKLGAGKVVRVELDTHGHANHYEGFTVTIYNRDEGPIAKKFFDFDDYLDRGARKDGREKDYPLSDTGLCFHASAPSWHWYIAVPETTKPLTQAIEAWVDMYR